MSDLAESGTCNADRFTSDSSIGVSTKETQILSVEIVSDVICPWCYVAKRQFGRGVAQLPKGIRLSVHWRPFELNPDMPPEGLDRVAYRSRKFGSWENSQRLDEQVTAAASQAGLRMRHDLMKRTPNTFKAHRLIWLAEKEGVQDAIVEGLFSAYFVEGRDVGDVTVLANIASIGGMNRSRVEAFLAGTEGAGEVLEAEMAVRRSGLNGVPSFIINGELAFSGAIRAEPMVAHLMKAAGLS